MKSVKIKKWDWLLIIGLCLAPMTGFRIWKVGPAELLCLIWGIKFLTKNTVVFGDVLKFFICFLIALFIGLLVGINVTPNELSQYGILVWLYLGIVSVLFYEGLRFNSFEYNEKMFFLIAQASILWYMFLYVYSLFVSRTFFSAPLWYSSLRFSGGGTNPHQVAVLLCGVLFVFIWKLLKQEEIIKCLLYGVFALFLLLQTKSSTGVLAIALGFGVFLYFKLADWFPHNKTAARILLVITVLIIGVIGYSYFYYWFMLWVADDPNGMGRLSIYSTIPITFIKSPVFGLGPGVHARDGIIEFHNTYLEILAATGLVGTFIFIFFTFRLFRKVIFADWRLFPIITTLYAYGFAGFAMRRLIYWGITVFVLVLAEQIILRKKLKDKANLNTE